jgi:hypothetical protein
MTLKIRGALVVAEKEVHSKIPMKEVSRTCDTRNLSECRLIPGRPLQSNFSIVGMNGVFALLILTRADRRAEVSVWVARGNWLFRIDLELPSHPQKGVPKIIRRQNQNE